MKFLLYRFLHTTPILDKDASSKIEETVNRLKEKQQDTLAEISKVLHPCFQAVASLLIILCYFYLRIPNGFIITWMLHQILLSSNS